MPANAAGPRRLTAEVRRASILDAAEGVFGSAGYHQATTRDIAVAAGVSEALLYQHFDSKRGLFEAVIERAAADLEARLRAAAGADDPLTAAVDGFFGFVEDHSELYRVFFRQALQADPAFADLYRGLTSRFLEICSRSLGEIPAERRPVIGHALSGMVTELGLWWIEDRRLDRAEIVQHAARMGRAAYETEV
jgi:AcrR family transcriptional regulator